MYQKLVDRRLKFNYSLNDMAKKLNISKTYYWQIENKKRGISYKIAFNISKILKCKPDSLFFDDFNSM